jgi:hypothetical protein
VSIVNSQIYSNTATYVRTHLRCHLQKFPSPRSPDGKFAHVIAPTHACTTANAPVNYSRYVPQRPCKVPIAPMGKLLTCLP